MHALSTHQPRITLEVGTQYRCSIVEAHLKAPYHIAAAKAALIKANTNIEAVTTLEKMISKSQEKLANRIGRYATCVFVDAKRLTLSAYSWPARLVAHEYGAAYNINNREQSANAIKKIPLQYVNPTSHAEILNCIVAVEGDLLSKKIENCIALSLRADGSVDRTNQDKIYVLAKIVNSEGKQETLFLGMGAQSQRGAGGLFNAIKEIINAAGEHLYLKVLKKMSSIVTDGASVNIGERSGLWKLIDDDAKVHNARQNILKIWCAAHRSDLSLKDLKKVINELPSVMRSLKKLSSFINKSSMRLALLREVRCSFKIVFFHSFSMITLTNDIFTSTVVKRWHA